MKQLLAGRGGFAATWALVLALIAAASVPLVSGNNVCSAAIDLGVVPSTSAAAVYQAYSTRAIDGYTPEANVTDHLCYSQGDAADAWFTLTAAACNGTIYVSNCGNSSSAHATLLTVWDDVPLGTPCDAVRDVTYQSAYCSAGPGSATGCQAGEAQLEWFATPGSRHVLMLSGLSGTSAGFNNGTGTLKIWQECATLPFGSCQRVQPAQCPSIDYDAFVYQVSDPINTPFPEPGPEDLSRATCSSAWDAFKCAERYKACNPADPGRPHRPCLGLCTELMLQCPKLDEQARVQGFRCEDYYRAGNCTHVDAVLAPGPAPGDDPLLTQIVIVAWAVVMAGLLVWAVLDYAHKRRRKEIKVESRRIERASRRQAAQDKPVEAPLDTTGWNEFGA